VADQRITRWIESASALLTHSHDKELPVAKRRELYRLCKAIEKTETPNVLVAIASSCAEFVRPFWESDANADPAISQLIDLTKRAHQGRLRESIELVLGTVRTIVDDRLSAEQDLRPAYAGFSALKAGHVAVYGEPSHDLGQTNESEMDPQEWDAAFYASLAFIGSATWEHGARPELREEFWRWYLGTVAEHTAQVR
jgi:hypothetical protein